MREAAPDLTGIVHEAWMCLHLYPPKGGWQSRAHFYGSACRAMRQIMATQALRRKAAKRGGGKSHTTLDEGSVWSIADQRILEIDEALRRLEAMDPRAASVAEMKLFGDLPMSWIAERLGVNVRTAQREWARASEELRSILSG